MRAASDDGGDRAHYYRGTFLQRVRTMLYLWLKALHIIAMVCWFAGLFYLPRLFVYHAMSTDEISRERFCIMERKL